MSTGASASDNGGRFAEVVGLLLEGSEAAAESALRRVASPPTPWVRRPSLPLSRQIEVFFRDGFSCRYCGRRTIFPPVLRALAARFPAVLRYHPNWKMAECDLAFWRESASCDHLVPVARGGSSEPQNLVTACYMCNSIKQNWLLEELRWELRPPGPKDWDGLAWAFPELARLVPALPRAYCRRWLAALEQSGRL